DPAPGTQTRRRAERRGGRQPPRGRLPAAATGGSPLDVWVAADRVETRGGGGCRAAALPAGVSLAPSSCRGLRRLPGDGLHLRMLILHLVFTLRESLKPQKNYVFYCQSCGDIIVKDR
uniref:Ubiquitin protein ligase E3D n=1 Tax=Accipiter nisus TaxID=211598 RepID=A0A8B9MG68_9AVES